MHVRISWDVLTHPTKGTAEVPGLKCPYTYILVLYVSTVPSASLSPPVFVLSPDIIRRVYRFQYNAWENACDSEAIRAGIGFGSGTETTPVFDCLHVQYDRKNWRWGGPGNDAILNLSTCCGGVHLYGTYV